ncbi:DUF6415 family natural product biosynthesis protein [Streptomyces sp. NPDC014748]|uniref:DUF6415 family natural product biosynthesis protein n=1 Tax=Streptomyces sp. NPDC014748 TaxID=3364905 RepID=UPI0036F5326E
MPIDGTEYPLDVRLMRQSALRLIGETAVVPGDAELDVLTLRMRGHLQLLIPEVEKAARARPTDDIPRYCALACVGEAGLRLNARVQAAQDALPRARRLARSLNALCDHYESLTEPMTCVLCDQLIGEEEASAPCGQVDETGSTRTSRAHRHCLARQRRR